MISWGKKVELWTALWLSLQVYNVDIKPGLIPKVLSILQIFYLAHTSFSVCILFIALGPYVSMRILACLGQLLAINNDWTDWVLITIIAGNMCQSLLFCWPMRVGIQFGLYPTLYQSADPQVRPTSFLTLVGWVTRFSVVLNIYVSDSVYDDNLWLLSLW